ncbi:hypothetical protein MSPP1_001795 [Malassezia sp. CBS 17886]|nr:hypothetical protein MSPP1_001795 [Malassezia sp. CBS 17886]
MEVPVAVAVGLVASFVQSLGLTLQRRSHLQNEKLPPDTRISEWRRPLWVTGFAVFLGANISGTLFQIGTLPVVILAPLGAVSLLYNALLARVLLDDFLSQHMVFGTALIAVGAFLIGFFGVVSDHPRPLDELLALFHRPPFVAFAVLSLFVLICVLTMAHLTEWQLLWQPAALPARTRRAIRRRWRSQMRHRLAAPHLATVAEVSENSSGITTPRPISIDAERARLLVASLHAPRGSREHHGTLPERPGCDAGAVAGPAPSYGAVATAPLPLPALLLPENRPTVLALAVTYSAASGTLSGVCLLLAKTGVDLLILSIRGENQFGSWLSWALVVVVFVAALLQLWYLHKSLKLADPVLVCPLAFCFYNVSSILLGLMYFNQLAALSWYAVALVFLGTVLLLCGVWVISLHNNVEDNVEAADDGVEMPFAWGPGWYDHASWSGEERERARPAGKNTAEGHDDGAQGPSAVPLVQSPREDVEQLPRALPQTPSRTEDAPSPCPSLLHASPTHARRSVSMPAPSDVRAERKGTISPDHALNEGLETPDRAHSTFAHRPTLYGILVERGLSIGLSPSSPGFHVLPRRAPRHSAKGVSAAPHGAAESPAADGPLPRSIAPPGAAPVSPGGAPMSPDPSYACIASARGVAPRTPGRLPARVEAPGHVEPEAVSPALASGGARRGDLCGEQGSPGENGHTTAGCHTDEHR